jgi:hypothetical protein
MPLQIRNNSSAWVNADDILIRNNAGAWVQGCAHIWDGTQWVQFFGQNGTLSAGGGYAAGTLTAISDSSSSAGSEFSIIVNTSGSIIVESVEAGTIDPGGFDIRTVLNTQTYIPTVCSPDPPFISVRLRLNSGTAPNIGGLSLDTWYDLSSSRVWALRATVTPAGGGPTKTQTLSGSYTLDVARTSDLATFVSSTSPYSATVTAISQAAGPPE